MNLEVDLDTLRATARDHMVKDHAMEAKACALMKQYGFFLPGPAKEFFRELANHLNWNTLKGNIK
jgi:hypothetical protein